MRCSHRAAHPLRRETLSALPGRQCARKAHGARLAGGPRGREGASPCGPRLRPARAPAPQCAAGVPAPSAVCGPAPGVASSLAAAPVARPPLRFLRTAPRLPCVARGGARAACGPGLGAARPLRRGRAAPPLAGPPGPVCVPSGSLFGRPPPLRPSRWFSRFAAPGAPPFGGPPVPRGASPRAPVPRLRSTRRGRARPAGRAYGARCAPAGVTGWSGAGSFAPFRPAFLPFLPQWARLVPRPPPAGAGGKRYTEGVEDGKNER